MSRDLSDEQVGTSAASAPNLDAGVVGDLVVALRLADANSREPADEPWRVVARAALAKYATQGTGGGVFADVEAQAEAWSDRVEIQDMVAALTSVFEERASPPLMSRFRHQVMAVIQQAFIEGATHQPAISTDRSGSSAAPIPGGDASNGAPDHEGAGE